MGVSDWLDGGVGSGAVVEGVTISVSDFFWVTQLHSFAPDLQQLQPYLNPLQHSQSRHSGNQNSAACTDKTPFWLGTAPEGKRFNEGTSEISSNSS